MDGMTRPVGDLPPEVYWRRRVVAIGLAVLVVLVLFYLIRPLFSGAEPDAPLTPGVTTSPSVTPTAEVAAAAASGPCVPGNVAIEMTPSPVSFAKGKIPTFTVRLINTGDDSCVLDTGTDSELHVTSGSDRIWNSDDCPGTEVLAAETFSLESGEAHKAEVTWPRIRSNSSCAANLPTPKAGWYHAILTVQGVDSNDTMFQLKN